MKRHTEVWEGNMIEVLIQMDGDRPYMVVLHEHGKPLVECFWNGIDINVDLEDRHEDPKTRQRKVVKAINYRRNNL